MTAPTAGPARLGWFVKQRRTQKRLSQASAANLAGFSRPVWANIENGVGTSYETTYVGVEEALQWVPGSCLATLAGGEPTALDPQLSTAEEKADAILALSTVEGLPDYEVAFLRGIAEKIRRQGDPSPNRTQSATG